MPLYRIILITTPLIVFLAYGGVILPVAAGAGDQMAIDPLVAPGQLIDIGGYRLHINCRGSGSPVVILDAGLGGSSLDWIYVQENLQKDTRVCAYDRAGYGWSDPGPPPRTTVQIVDELDLLLARANIPPPYILVGHSFGGYNMQYFAKAHPSTVAGLVLVDSSHPDQAERMPELPAHADIENGGGDLVTFFDPNVVFKYYGENMWLAVGRLMSSRKAVQTQQRELFNFNMSAYQVKELGSLPDIPLVVISHGLHVWPDDPLGQAREREWRAMQLDLVRSVPHGRQVIAAASGHLIQLQQPELVAESIRQLLKSSAAPPRGGHRH